ncbi:MAG: HEAT repeat domain-containing protein [Fimbriimonadaceae bacterium]|nr:HEAT repeat domain-containing protein [Fimbriimonadaceae bacterium]
MTVGDVYRYLVSTEATHGGVLPAPNYDALAAVAAHWAECWPEFLATGGGSGVVRAVVGGIRDPAAHAMLTAFVRQRDQDLLLRCAALVAVARTAEPGSEDLLLELLESDPALRGDAARELARSGSPWARLALATELQAGGEWNCGLAVALARRGDRAAVTLLLELATAGHAPAIGALGDLAVPAAVAVLLPWLTDGEPLLRETAVAALGQIGDPRAVPHLLGSLDDADSEVVSSVCEAVEAIAGQRPPRSPGGNPVQALRSWWHEARRPLIRWRCFRDGRKRSLGDGIDELAASWRAVLRPDRTDRLAARLQLQSGADFGFDAWDLDATANRAALRQWARWWEDNAARFPAGYWYWQGEPLLEPTRWE